MNNLIKLTSRLGRTGSRKLNKNIKNTFRMQQNGFRMLTKMPVFKFSSPQEFNFQAETKKLLDIVAKSMYTDKEVFLRELLSNCSDALEKQRFKALSEGTQDNIALEIDIFLDEDKKTIEIFDSGIGMDKQTLINNLGTIAKSGSEEFRNEMKNTEDSTGAADSIIGQFGIGFYSSFIVGDRIQVLSRQGENCYSWVSDGSGTFEISEVDQPDFERGTKIIIELRSDCLEFAKKSEVQRIIQKYSNFIKYPIAINGEQQNLVQALWSKSKLECKEQDYVSFWEHFSKQKTPYQFKLHYQVDAPLTIKSLIYIPSTHNEKFGMQQEEQEVHLYSRKVLIKEKCRDILPQYLRFVKGVVDCEDLPLNISRENYQDSALIARLSNVMTGRVLKELADQAKRNPEEYLKWYNDFQFFIKEGLAMDQNNSKQLQKLVRYQVNYTNDLVTLEDYVKNSIENQKKIYYILSPSPEHAQSSPYIEPFKGTNIPVIILNIHIDEMIFRQMDNYENFKFVNIESDYDEVQRDLKELIKEDQKSSQEQDSNVEKLSEDEQTPFCLWAKNELAPVVSRVQVSDRLKDSPAIVVSAISSGMRQMMAMMDKNSQMQQQLEQNQNLTLEINPAHPIFLKLNKVRKYDSEAASLVMKQVLDNCLVQSGIQIDQSKYMSRIQNLMLKTLDTSLNQINANEFVQQNYDGSQAQRETQQQQGEVETEVIIDEQGNPRVVEKSKK